MADGHPPRVLVLEDEWMIADLIKGALEASGFEVVGPVGRVAQALALLQRVGCDAAVLDVNLNGERSFGVAEKLAETSTPFVFVSGYSAAELPDEFRERPLMQKPVDMNALCSRVTVMLRGVE